MQHYRNVCFVLCMPQPELSLASFSVFTIIRKAEDYVMGDVSAIHSEAKEEDLQS